MSGVNDASTRTVVVWAEPIFARGDLSLTKELFSLLSVVDSSAGLRRALTDPTREAADRSALVAKLVGGKVSADAESVLEQLAQQRWSNPRDIADALETVAAHSAISVAEREGQGAGLERLENDLFAFNDVVGSSHDLQRALSEPQASSEAKVTLARALTRNVSDVAQVLIDQAVASPRGMHPAKLIEKFAELAAARQQRWIAFVTVARPLTEEQQYRLQVGLNRLYQRELKLNISLDPALVGGVRVLVGDEVLDASVLNRLNELQRTLGQQAS